MFNDGQFLHHVPKVDMKSDGSVAKTAHIVAVHGWEVDLPLWTDAAELRPVPPRQRLALTVAQRRAPRAPAARQGPQGTPG
ncbi:hypothetical protein [Streptomyces shenzhenensis]|uniref:hypothetical protein n=1 Tax=Streptomyces shenzhenensis TaxID=943815 RepID=UPI0015F013D0|nr:hypothetical protein [Streptomyces shenzhenensis]